MIVLITSWTPNYLVLLWVSPQQFILFESDPNDYEWDPNNYELAPNDYEWDPNNYELAPQ